MHAWLRALNELERDGEPAVLVTVVTARGSTPREAGCKMVVTADTQYDTIGGGNLEFTCVEAARKMLDGTGGPVLRDFPLGPSLGQCCGGHVSVLFEPLAPSLSHVALFGAGHVGRALIGLLANLRLRVTWFDTRADALAEVPFGIDARHTADPAADVASLPAGSILLVMTHDHQIDFDIVAASMTRADFSFVGLIGSETKRARFVRRLARLGVPPEAVGRLVCPIGVAGAGGKLPAEIAISVAAQILQVQQQTIGKNMAADKRDNRARLVHSANADCPDCDHACDGDGARLAARA
jgi:xanthine dehydrogenase accessory factor